MRKSITFAIVAALTISILGCPLAGYGATAPQVAKTTGLKAKAVSDKTIKLKWKKTQQASGYEVYKYHRKKKTYKKIAVVKKNSFKCTKLKANTKYRFQVRAYVSQDHQFYYGPFSKTVKCKTQKSPGEKVVAKARKKLGAAYRSGAAGPNSFDCSGFVYWVYKSAGVKPKKRVIRSSCSGLYSSLRKYKVGSSIKSIKKAKAGDILLFTRGGHFSHAAIYAGKGKIIHASTPGKHVQTMRVKTLHNSGTRVAAIIRIV